MDYGTNTPCTAAEAVKKRVRLCDCSRGSVNNFD
jgi:hypothetical protein